MASFFVVDFFPAAKRFVDALKAISLIDAFNCLIIGSMSAVVQQVVFPHPVFLSDLPLLGMRNPPRPPALRPQGYLSEFDANTLWYDVFFSSARQALVAVGPPQLDLRQKFHATDGFTDGINFWPATVTEMDRCSQVSAIIQDQRSATLRFQGAHAAFGLSISPDHSEWFEGKRVVLTLSKNNELAWIEDWARYYVKRHGADAILFYDNGSTLYPPSALADLLGNIEGLASAIVVHWPFPFGPVGGGKEKLPWDSDFCKHGMFAHAHWRFLAKARCVLNCDIDELIACQEETSIFRLCEESAEGYLHFTGEWCFALADSLATKGGIRHRDHTWILPGHQPCPSKWALVPERLPSSVQWTTHSVKSGRPLPPCAKKVRYWHFSGINTSWKYVRRLSEARAAELVRSEEFSNSMLPWL